MTFLPFARPSLDEATIAGVGEVLRSGWLASGPWVQAFEQRLSALCGGRPVRVLTSATAAVEVALQVAGIGPGDEVISAAQSFFTVPNMIAKVGATPVFVDCDLVTRNIDVASVEKAITTRTRAIVPTHWPGSTMDLRRPPRARATARPARDRGRGADVRHALRRALRRVVRRHHDVQLPPEQEPDVDRGRRDRGERSRGGKRVEVLRFHGIERLPDGTRDVAFPGGKFNLPDVNARIGVGQLDRLEAMLARRRALAERYFARWPHASGCVLPPMPVDGDGATWNMFCVLLPLERMAIDRAAFREAMQREGIGTGVSYEALHLCTLGRRYGGREGQFPNAERIARETVTLPLFVDMRDEDVDRVCAAVGRILAAHRR
jgi:dTDP-4-amino-4,6-dideoxygalactose transaminase